MTNVRVCVFVPLPGVQRRSARLPVPLAYTTKLPAQRSGGGGGVDEAAQWQPSGHYELQRLAGGTSGGHLGTRELRLCAAAAAVRDTKGITLRTKQEDNDVSCDSMQTVCDACRLPDVVCPQRDLQLPQDFGRFLHPPAKLLRRIGRAS